MHIQNIEANVTTRDSLQIRELQYFEWGHGAIISLQSRRGRSTCKANETEANAAKSQAPAGRYDKLWKQLEPAD